MTRTRKYFFPTAAVTLALGVGGLTLTAQEDAAPAGHLHAVKRGAIFSDATPDAGLPTVFTALLNIAANPPADKGGNPYWPCFTGGSDTDCSSIPSGAIVLGEPLSAAVVPHTCKGCAQIYWVVESTSAAKSGDIKVVLTVKQGSTTIFSFSGDSGLTLPPGEIAALWYDGVTFTGGKSGTATISVTNTVGTVKSTSTTTVLLK
jgi:hypothetical protein